MTTITHNTAVGITLSSPSYGTGTVVTDPPAAGNSMIATPHG
jgi:hypothetical protein